MKLVIPRLPISPNKLRYQHWRKAHRDKNDWLEQVWAALKPNQRVQCAEKERKQVKVALFSPYRPLDPDNAHGALKPILDALKGNQLIYDDAAEWLEYSVSQHKLATKKEARTEIVITALGG